MADITTEHLHHLARRHHQAMKKFDGLRDKITGFAEKTVGTIETLFGALAGGVVEGRTGGMAVGPIPLNLGVGLAALVVGHWGLAGPWSSHVNNIGNGFIGSYVAATGYAFGKRWKETGKMFGGGGHPYLKPYEDGWTATSGDYAGADLSEAQMAAIVQRMQAAAAAPAA